LTFCEAAQAMLKIGHYRPICEAHLAAFPEHYSAKQSIALVHTRVSRPVPSAILAQSAHWLEASLPQAKFLLEDLWEGMSLKVQAVICENAARLRDEDDPEFIQLIVTGIYRRNPRLVAVKCEEEEKVELAEEFNDNGDCMNEFSALRKNL
jgi:hypothetical protein